MTLSLPQNRLSQNYREILIGLGENPDREGLRDTPRHSARRAS